MNLDSTLIKILDRKTFQISQGKISLEELEILNEILTTPNLLLSTRTGLKCWVALGYVHLGQKDKLILIVKEIIEETGSDGVEAFKIIQNIEFVLDYLGNQLLNLQEYELAQKTFRLALDQAKLESKTQTIAIISSHLALSYYYLKDFDKSSRLLEIASSIFPEVQDSITSLILSAKLKYKQNDLIKTLSLIENALRLSKKINNNSLSEIIQLKIVDLQREILIKNILQEDAKIFQYMENITQTLKNLGKTEEICASYYESGMILEKRGYFNEAMLYYEEASRISYDNEIWSLYARVSLQLGLMAFNQKDLKIALSYCDQVLQIAEYLEDKDLESLGLKLQKAIKKSETFLQESPIKSQENTVRNDSVGSESVPLSNSLDLSDPVNNVPADIEEAAIDEVQTIEDYSNSSVSQEPSPLEFDSFAPLHESTEINFSPINDSPEEVIEQNTIQTHLGEERTFESIRNEISEYLTSNGFLVEFDITPYNGTSSIDIIASKGNIRKKKMYIMISGNEGEASLAGYLFNSLLQSGKKIIYLETGNAEVVVIPKDVTIATSIEELPLSF